MIRSSEAAAGVFANFPDRLLAAKLLLPRTPPSLVPRPRLLAQLDAAQSRRLLLLAAPAGSGKTTLLANWLQERRAPDRPVAWLTLESDDNEPVRFWTYFIAAMKATCPGLEQDAPPLQAGRERPASDFLASVINKLCAGLTDEVLLGLDGLDRITNPGLHAQLCYLFENLPPCLHIAVTTRHIPPWPLVGWRARGDVWQIAPRSLHFTVDEASTLMTHHGIADLSGEDMTTLAQHTEGWAVGLQLAALALGANGDPSRFLQSFSGRHHLVLDFFMTEVFRQQKPEICRFMLEISVLDRLTGPLCQAVTAAEDAGQLLTQMAQANLFILPIDDERRWYRYYQLFAEMLQHRLSLKYPEKIPGLHKRASAWFATNGQFDDAMHHALLTGDTTIPITLLAGNALPLAYQGRVNEMNRWLDALPPAQAADSPWLKIAHAWMLTFSGRIDAARDLLSQMPDLTGAESAHIEGHHRAILAAVASFRGEFQRAIRVMGQALQLLPEADRPAIAFAHLTIGSAQREMGHFVVARKHLARAVTGSEQYGTCYLTLAAIWERTALELYEGRLKMALKSCEAASVIAQACERVSGRRSGLLTFIQVRFSGIHYEWNDLPAAAAQAASACRLALQWGQAGAIVWSHTALAQVQLASGEYAAALGTLQTARERLIDRAPWHTEVLVGFEAWLHTLQARDPDQVPLFVHSWIARQPVLPANGQVHFDLYARQFLLARVLLALGEYADALDVLSPLHQLAQKSKANGVLVRVIMLQVAALAQAGDIEHALDKLTLALNLGASEGYCRVYLDQPALAQLLPLLLQRHAPPTSAYDLLPYFSNSRQTGRPEQPGSMAPRVDPLVEPLTTRESEILGLLASGLSNAEIAQALHITLHTVKWHASNIYGKLGVRRRMSAVRRARALGIL